MVEVFCIETWVHNPGKLDQRTETSRKSEHVWYIVSMCTLQSMHLLRKHSVMYTTLFRLATTLVDFTADGQLNHKHELVPPLARA